MDYALLICCALSNKEYYYYYYYYYKTIKLTVDKRGDLILIRMTVDSY